MMVARSSENANRNLAEIRRLNRLKAFEEYHKTQDILRLQRTLGHKHLRTTLAYITLDSKSTVNKPTRRPFKS
jgi:vacuolar-type H+-ATPase subunit C/Vma6